MNRHLNLSALLLAMLLIAPAPTHAGFFDDLLRALGTAETPTAGLDDATIARGLKEALATGTGRAVSSVSKQDGFFGNRLIKIAMPEKLRTAADLVATIGFRKEVDDVVLGMNRAAEKAAPKATEHFMAALKAMTFDDARTILQGGNTSATDYFRRKTGEDIYREFKPVVASSMQDVGAIRSYRQMTERFSAIPYAGHLAAFDLEAYVTDKAVEGLFIMLGEEEKKIRTDPAARGSELLRQVFGK